MLPPVPGAALQPLVAEAGHISENLVLAATALGIDARPCGGVFDGLYNALLGLDGRLGLQGWQWLFLLEGVPSVLVGIAVLALLPDRPRNAPWMPPEERELLERELATEAAPRPVAHGESLGRTLSNPLVR